MRTFFIFAEITGAEIVDNAAAGSTIISNEFNTLWQQTLNGGLYTAMCSLGQLFAVATIVFFLVDMAKNWMNGDDGAALANFIWPIIVISLLFNNGAFLRDSTLAMRGIVNKVNNDVLAYTAASVNLNESFKKVVNNVALSQEVNAAIQQCGAITGGTQKAVDCLNTAKQEIDKKYDALYANVPTSQANYDKNVGNPLQGALDALSGAGDAIASGLSSAITGFATVILLALCNAYQWAIEFCMLLTALLGPLAVGASLLPYGAKQIFTLLKSFFGLGMAKVAYNIVIGLCGELVSNSEQNQPMIFLLFIAIFSPLIATGLAAGGGLALFGAVGVAASAGVGIGTQVASSASGSVGGAINRYKANAEKKEASATAITRHHQMVAATRRGGQ